MTLGSKRHSELTDDDVGSIIWKTVTDSAARLALSVTSTHNGRVVRQSDVNTLWVLVDYSGPTWVQIG